MLYIRMTDSEGCHISLPCSLLYKADSNVLENNKVFPLDILDRYPLFNNNFQYLEAVRTGPCTDYPMSYADVIEHRQIGLRGEYAVHFLNAFGSEMKVLHRFIIPQPSRTRFYIRLLPGWEKSVRMSDLRYKKYQVLTKLC